MLQGFQVAEQVDSRNYHVSALNRIPSTPTTGHTDAPRQNLHAKQILREHLHRAWGAHPQILQTMRMTAIINSEASDNR